MMHSPLQSSIVIGLNAVIVAVTDEEPRILAITLPDAPDPDDALPYGPLDPAGDRTLELTLRGWVHEQTGLELGYVEQLYTFGDRNRDPRERLGGPREISIGYLTLAREGRTSGGQARWRPWYDYLPWEDWREGRPAILARTVEPALQAWCAAADSPGRLRLRQERVTIAFGLNGAPWDSERVLDRYELLYEAGLVGEAKRDQQRRRTASSETAPPSTTAGALHHPPPGRTMCFDHRRILATAVGRLRGKIRYRPVVFELLPPTFTLLQLQRVVEALAGLRLHKQNFRRLVERGGLVEGTGQQAADTGGRPAELFRFRREVLRERPTPGIGLPKA